MVFNAVSSRVRWAFSAVAVLFMSDPTPSEMDFILPVSDLHLQVDPWATLALSPGARRDVAKDTIVKSTTHYKSRTNKKHEKLLIVLQTPHAGTITYMVTDRGPDPDEMEARRNEHSSMSLSPVGSSANLSLPSGDVWANDRIFIPGTLATHILLADNISCTPNELLYRLCSEWWTMCMPNTVNSHSAHSQPSPSIVNRK
jgi:hypothetical protein